MDSMASFGDFGFRQCRSVNVAETGYFDDFKVTDNSTGTEKVAFYCDFEKENPLGIGSIQEGRLYVEPIAGEVYTESLIKETSAPMFRKEFTVDSNKTVKSAKLYATALGVYEAYINGQKVGADKLAPGWTDYNDYVLYQTFDITNMLQQDANAIGAVVGDGWYAGHVSTGGGNFNKYGKKTAFLGKLKIEYTDGSSELCVTDATWKNIKTGPFVATDNQDGETYDARKELPGWDSPNFDETAWTNADIASKTNLASTFEPQTIDRVAQIGPAIEVTEELPVLTRTEPTPDTFIYDLGQNVAGWAKIKIQGPAGAKVKIRFGEMLYDGKPITLQYKQEPTSKGSLYTDNLRTAKATDYYILKGDPDGEIYEPRFTYHGFRYIEITCNDPSVIIPGIEDVKGVVVGTNTERVGNYETSDAKVNQLYSNIVWGQRGNFMSVPTDCPQRDERLGWTGDAQVFSRTAMMNMDVNQFFKKYAKDLDYAQLDNGAIFDIAPSQGHAVGAGNAGWGDAAVIIPWNMYTTYGDKQIIRDSYDMMKKWINYCRDTSGKSAGKTYIIANCAYGDWLSMGESTPNDVVATAYFAYSTKLFANMAEVIGNTADASAYNALFENIKNEFNTTFVDADVRIKGNSQTAYLLALSMDLLPQESRAKAGEHLVERIVASNYHLSTGFLGVNILCPVLSEMGYSDLAYELLLTETFPSWLYSVANGATTIWERWNSYTIDGGFGPVGMNSFNHYSYGAVGEWMFNNSAGIDLDIDKPAYKHILIKPEPNKAMSYVKASYNSVYGEIKTHWTLNQGQFKLNVTIPANTTATVELQSNVPESLKVDGMPYAIGTTEIEGVEYIRSENGKEIFEIASGSYTFESEIAETFKVKIDTEDSTIKSNIVINDNEVKTMPYQGTFAKATTESMIKLEVQPMNDVDYAFTEWSDGNTENPRIVKVDQDIELKVKYSYKGLDNIALGKSVTAKTSEGGAPSWGTSNLTDGKYIHQGGVNGYTSTSHDNPDRTSDPEYVIIDLGQDVTFDKIHLYPRTDTLTTDEKVINFPKNFTIEVKKDADSTYSEIINETDYAAPMCYGNPAVVDFTSQTARYIKINALVLGDRDIAGNDKHRFQLAEVGVYNSTNIPDKIISSVTALQAVTVPVGTTKESLTLPETVTTILNDGTRKDLGVVWDLSTYSETEGTYVLKGTIQLEGGIVNSNNLEAEISVVVEQAQGDTEPPVIKGADNRTIYVGDDFDAKAGVTATDNVDGDITSKLQILGTVETTTAGVYTLDYEVSDTAGNKASATRHITVQEEGAADTVPPVINGTDDRTIYVGDDFDAKAGVTATDDVDGDITDDIQIAENVDTAIAGEYTVEYKVKDKAGNETSVTRYITVQEKPAADTVAPVIKGVDDRTIYVGNTFDALAGVTAIDEVDGDVTSRIKVEGIVNTQAVGSYTLTYTVADNSGNRANRTRIITVRRRSSDSTPSDSGSNTVAPAPAPTLQKQQEELVVKINKLSQSEKTQFIAKVLNNIPYTATSVLKEIKSDKLEKEVKDLINKDLTVLGELGINLDKEIAMIELASGESKTFKDLQAKHWAANEISDLVAIGVVKGYEDDTFRPQEKITASDTFVFLDRVLLLNNINDMKLSRSTVEKYVTDKEHWSFYSKASIGSKLNEATLVKVAALGDKPLSREMLAQVLYEITTANLDRVGTAVSFNDIQDSEYKDAINYCVETGLLRGMPNNAMDPRREITRAELMAVLGRLNSMLSNKDSK
jgi:hypothetical protein